VEVLGLAGFEGMSVTMSPQTHCNLAVSSPDGINVFSAQDILRGLGDPRDHVDVKSCYDVSPSKSCYDVSPSEVAKTT